MHASATVEGDVAAAELAATHRAYVVRRLPTLAALDLAVTSVWLVSLVAAGDVSGGAAACTMAFQALVLAGAIAACSLRAAAGLVVPIVALAVTLVGLSWVGLFAFAVGSGVVLGFIVFVVFIGAAIGTAWGWGPQLAVQLPVTAGWLLALPSLTKRLSASERLAAVGIGSALALVVAEWAKRALHDEIRRRRAEAELGAELAASRDAFRDVYENARDFIWMADLKGRLTYANAALARLRGEPAEAIVGRTVADLLTDHPENPPRIAWKPGIARIRTGERLPTMIVQVHSATGPRWMESVISPLRDRDGRVNGLQSVNRDVTERRETEEALRVSEARHRNLVEQLVASEQKLRLLAQRQVSVREEERTRLGFDLHDDVCQELVGIQIIVEAVRQRLERDVPGAAADLTRAGQYLTELVEHLRAVARELRPMLLHDLGLEDSLRSLAHGLSSTATVVELVCPEPIPRLDASTELAVYRIAQESLANALRHSGARSVVLGLSANESRVTLEVRDDGCGFEPDDRRDFALGLLSMEERAIAVNGRLEVISAPAHGTTVRLRCPLTTASSAA